MNKSPTWFLSVFIFAAMSFSCLAETILFKHGIIHTVANGTLTNGSLLVRDGKISGVFRADSEFEVPLDATLIDLRGQHLYPGLIALNTSLGITEIESVRATRDNVEVGEFTPDVQSWIAVNPDSELIPVARANGIAYFEPSPKGSIVSGQSALLSTSGWTYEEMTVRQPAALHVFWPSMELDTTPKDKSRDAAKLKSLEEQSKARNAKVRAIADFFDEAKAYGKAKEASSKVGPNAPVPAWEAMLPYVRSELPIVIHADEVRQIRTAVNWATTNRFRVILAGARDAWMLADLIATNHIPVIFESIFESPMRDTDSPDQNFRAPGLLHQAGVKVSFGLGEGGFTSTSLRNLPYAAAHAVAYGLPEDEALKGLTLYPAEALGISDRLGSIEAGKDATLFICSGNIFDLRSIVQRMWISGNEVSLENRHTRLHEKYRNRPAPLHP